MASFGSDLSYALRQIVRHPGGPLIIVLSLGSALGINTSLFSVVNATWFTPWTVKDVESVRVVRPGISLAEWREWSEQTRSFSGLAAQRGGPLLRLGGQRIRVDFVSANYFQVLRIPILAGRDFFPGEDVAASENTAVISHHVWQTRFGGDPNIVGRSITLDPLVPRRKSVTVVVVGVASSGFEGTTILRTQFWLPLGATRAFDASGGNQTAEAAVMAFGRLAPGVSDQQARAELSTLIGPMGSASRSSRPPIQVHTTDRFSQSPPPLQTRLMLGTLLAGIAFITLIGCANAANLLLARGHARRSEIAVRLALGASRARVIRLFLAENVVLIVGAAWLGIVIARWLPETVLRSLFQSVSPNFAEIIWLTFPLDHRVFLWVLAMSLTACVAFGLAPALRCTDVSVGDVLKDAGGIPRTAFMSSLLSYQTIVSVMALAIAGLMLRSEPVVEARAIRRSVADLTIVRLDIPPGLDAVERPVVVATLSEALRATAGHQNVAGTTGPLQPETNQSLEVTPEYFALLNIRSVLGRTFVPSDPVDRVMVVNEAFAQRFWPGQNAIGQALAPGDGRVLAKVTGRQVVGVIDDNHVSNPTAYLPAAPDDLRMFLVGVARDRIMREAVALITRQHPSVTIDVLSGSAWMTPAAGALLVSAYVTMSFGAIALVLGTVGFFSLLEYAVRQRTREIGVRCALGAEPRHIVGSLLAPASRALIRALFIGSAGAACVGAVLRQVEMPAGVNPLDALTYVGVAAVLATAGFLASYVPARRALRIAPGEALRYE